MKSSSSLLGNEMHEMEERSVKRKHSALTTGTVLPTFCGDSAVISSQGDNGAQRSMVTGNTIFSQAPWQQHSMSLQSIKPGHGQNEDYRIINSNAEIQGPPYSNHQDLSYLLPQEAQEEEGRGAKRTRKDQQEYVLQSHTNNSYSDVTNELHSSSQQNLGSAVDPQLLLLLAESQRNENTGNIIINQQPQLQGDNSLLLSKNYQQPHQPLLNATMMDHTYPQQTSTSMIIPLMTTSQNVDPSSNFYNVTPKTQQSEEHLLKNAPMHYSTADTIVPTSALQQQDSNNIYRILLTQQQQNVMPIQEDQNYRHPVSLSSNHLGSTSHHNPSLHNNIPLSHILPASPSHEILAHHSPSPSYIEYQRNNNNIDDLLYRAVNSADNISLPQGHHTSSLQQLLRSASHLQQQQNLISPPANLSLQHQQNLISPPANSSLQQQQNLISPPKNSSLQQQQNLMSPPANSSLQQQQNLISPPANSSLQQQQNLISPPANSSLQQQNLISPPKNSSLQQQQNLISPPKNSSLQQQQNLISPPKNSSSTTHPPINFDENLVQHCMQEQARNKQGPTSLELALSKKNHGIISITNNHTRSSAMKKSDLPQHIQEYENNNKESQELIRKRPFMCLGLVKKDKYRLSNFLCFLRAECIEVFKATESDVYERRRSKKVSLGQVGIRCRFCAHAQYPHQRVGRSSSFPSSLNRLYQSVTMMVRDHFSKCKMMLPEVRQKFIIYKNCKSHIARKKITIESKSYWVESASILGMSDTADGGIRMTVDIVPMNGDSDTKKNQDHLHISKRKVKNPSKEKKQPIIHTKA